MQTPPAIELLLKNWKTTSPGFTMIGGALWAMYTRYQMGGSWLPNEVEFTAIAGGIGLIYAKAHNVTGGDKSNGLTPNPVQEAKAQIDVALATAEPIKPPANTAEVIKIKQEMDAFGERVKAQMEAFNARLANAVEPPKP